MKYPEVGEVVIGIVKRISGHAAFVELPEYGKEAMLHISEISSKWVRNIKEHLRVGQQIICKVIHVDPAKGYIDVSIKRVTSGERKRKLNEWKLAKRCEAMIDAIGRRLRARKELRKKVMDEIISKFGSLYEFLNQCREVGSEVVDKLELTKRWKEELRSEIEAFRESIKVEVKRELIAYSLTKNGVERIKKILTTALNDGFNVVYIAAPRYLVSIKGLNYKELEKKMDEEMEKLNKLAAKEGVYFEVKD